jgi:hypothetical protein
VIEVAITMIELLQAFFVASTVVGSAAGASVGALSKAACIRLFRLESRRLPVRLLLRTAVAENVIMSISLAIALTMIEPYATPQLKSKGMLFAALFCTAATFHVLFAWFPNLYLLGRISPASNRPDKTFADFAWAGVLASMTPCAVVLIALGVRVYCFR